MPLLRWFPYREILVYHTNLASASPSCFSLQPWLLSASSQIPPLSSNTTVLHSRNSPTFAVLRWASFTHRTLTMLLLRAAIVPLAVYLNQIQATLSSLSVSTTNENIYDSGGPLMFIWYEQNSRRHKVEGKLVFVNFHHISQSNMEQKYDAEYYGPKVAWSSEKEINMWNIWLATRRFQWAQWHHIEMQRSRRKQ